MDYGRWAERLMAMDDRAWSRHANPWSVYTRIPILPLLAFAIFSRVWLGWWALVPVAALMAWAFINPRAFPVPKTTDSWASRGTLGERLWLNRANVAIPRHHSVAAAWLTGAQGVGLLPLVYGLIALNPWATVAGTAITLLAKMWFVDRMVWLYDEAGDGAFTNRP